MKIRPFPVLFLVAALLGLVFTGFSTSDFVEHLDRQVHAIHCSFVPGLAAPDVNASSGCHTALMSPYSSILRTWVWGGLPMALLGMGTFAFLLFRGVELVAHRRQSDLGAALFLVAASVVPVLTSIVMGSIAIFELGAACKVCIGIYLSSFTCFAAAIGMAVQARRPSGDVVSPPADGMAGDTIVPPETSMATLLPPGPQGALGHAIGVGEGVLFVAVPALLYLAMVPDHGRFVGTCGALVKADDPAKVMIPLESHPGAAQAIEVFDPLCPACRGFEKRLAASGLDEKLDRKAVLFPLDTSCNWMVGQSLHPGACVVSEAVLCAGDQPQPVIDWAFENQEAIKDAASKDPAAAEQMVDAAFPQLKSCVGGSEVKQRLNRSLRWTVQNKLPVLTPQLYVDGVKLCDEDTDLGMDFALTKLLDHPVAKEATP